MIWVFFCKINGAGSRNPSSTGPSKPSKVQRWKRGSVEGEKAFESFEGENEGFEVPFEGFKAFGRGRRTFEAFEAPSESPKASKSFPQRLRSFLQKPVRPSSKHFQALKAPSERVCKPFSGGLQSFPGFEASKHRTLTKTLSPHKRRRSPHKIAFGKTSKPLRARTKGPFEAFEAPFRLSQRGRDLRSLRSPLQSLQRLRSVFPSL